MLRVNGRLTSCTQLSIEDDSIITCIWTLGLWIALVWIGGIGDTKLDIEMSDACLWWILLLFGS